MSVEINNLMNNYDKNKKNYKTTPKITKYERTRVLSERANQIDNGSAIFLTNQSRYENSYQIAMEEYNQGLIPFIIKRKIGNSYEYWKLEDLIK